MKTSYLDFLLCGVAIGAIVVGTLGLIVVLLPLTQALALEYHVIVDLLLALLFYGLLSALLVRLLTKLRPLPSGEYALDSPVFTYWKLLTIVYRLGQDALLPFTPVFVRPLVAALFGARVGANVALGGTIDDPYLVEIGDGAVLGNASLVSGNMLNGGKFVCGPVKIGAGATVGVNSVVLPNTQVGENSTLLGGSYVLPGSNIPAGETWRGNPARKWL
jgi:serine acetyltransferase